MDLKSKMYIEKYMEKITKFIYKFCVMCYIIVV